MRQVPERRSWKLHLIVRGIEELEVLAVLEALELLEVLAAADEDIRPPAVATSATLPPDPFPNPDCC